MDDMPDDARIGLAVVATFLRDSLPPCCLADEDEFSGHS
jgi:hypothetical protein